MEDLLLLTALEDARDDEDYALLLSTARSFQYWAMRLELAKPGPVDDELAKFAESDIKALRRAIRQGWHLLREPAGDWRRKGAFLLAEIAKQPLLAGLAESARGTLASQLDGTTSSPRELTRRWGPDEGPSRVLDRELFGHRGAVTACRVLSDGTTLVTCDDTEVLVWDTATGALRAIHADTGADRAEVFDAWAPRSGDWLATVAIRGGVTGAFIGNAAALKVWDLRNGARPRTLFDDRDGPYACELSPDERWLVSHHDTHAAYFWDTRTWKLAGVIRGQSRDVVSGLTGTCYAPDGSWFAMVNEDGSIGLWDPEARTLRHLLRGHRAQISGRVELAAPLDSSWLASMDGRELRIWDTRRGILIGAVDGIASGCAGLVADPAGQWAAACFGPDTLRVVPVAGQGPRGGIAFRLRRTAVRVRLAAGRQADLWIFRDASCAIGDNGMIVSVTAIEAEAGEASWQQYLVSSWDAAGRRVAGPAERGGDLPRLAVLRGGKWAATLSRDRVEVLDQATMDVLARFTHTPDRIRGAAVGRGLLATGFESGMVRLFRPGLGSRGSGTRERAPAGLTDCFAAPHGRWLLAWSGRTAVVLDRPTGAVRFWMEGETTGLFLSRRPNGCCVAPDGSWVATADDDGTVRVWDPDVGQQSAQASGEELEDFLPGSCASARWMATVRPDGHVSVRDRRGVRQRELAQSGTPRRGCADGDVWLAVETETGTSVWDPLTGARLCDLPGEYGPASLPAGPAAPYSLLATTGATGDVRVSDPLTGKRLRTYGETAQSEAARGGIMVRAAHPDGDWLIVTDDQGRADIWSVADGTRRRFAGGYGDPIAACAVSADGSMLATVMRSGALRVVETATCQEIAAARADGSLSDCCWPPGGREIYAVGHRGAYCYELPRARRHYS